MSRSDTIQGIIEDFSRLSHSAGKRRDICGHHLSDTNLSPAHASILHAISHHRKMTTNKIADTMGVTKSAVSQLTEGLVKDCLLTRSVDPCDRRIAHLSVTHKGHRLMRMHKKHAIENIRVALGTLTDKELKTLHNLSQKITNNAAK